MDNVDGNLKPYSGQVITIIFFFGFQLIMNETKLNVFKLLILECFPHYLISKIKLEELFY